MSLLLDAYQKRDRIAMVSFRKEEAVVNLPPTASIELASTLLAKMPVGGRTPLSAGLAKSYEVLRNYLLREPTGRPIAIIITDGRSNVAMGTGRPLDEVLADRLALDARIRFIVVDTESGGLVTFGMAHQLAAALNARYFKIEDLTSGSIIAPAICGYWQEPPATNPAKEREGAPSLFPRCSCPFFIILPSFFVATLTIGRSTTAKFRYLFNIGNNPVIARMGRVDEFLARGCFGIGTAKKGCLCCLPADLVKLLAIFFQ